MKKFLASIFLALTLLLPFSASARPVESIQDWYIKDRKIDIVVNKDSSIDVTENLLADCGNVPGKHGVFYSIPTFYQSTSKDRVDFAVNLVSITHNGEAVNYSTSTSYDILTWKIGDADITVSGENDYVIKYKVRRAIRFNDPDFDEFYWNIAGDFSILEDDHLIAKVTFPPEITSDNTQLNGYSGAFGLKDIGAVEYKWIEKNILQIESKRTLGVGEGATVSVTFPKNILIPPVLTFWEKYGAMILGMIMLLLPLFMFFYCFRLWLKYGKDYKLGRSIAPEFEIPDKMEPMEMGTFLGNGTLNSKYISSSIVNLAVKGYLKIEEIPKKGIFSSADTKFIKTSKDDTLLSEAERDLLSYIFSGTSQEILLSSLKNTFYSKIPLLKSTVMKVLNRKKVFEKEGSNIQSTMMIIGFLFLPATFFIPTALQAPMLYLTLGSCAAIFLIFGALMPRRSLAGTELLGRVRGFKMYMMTAEKYRQKFNEKENIFERFLPYAMMFGITSIWVNKMKQIYGEEYFNTYHPVWYAGAFGNFDKGFDVNSFTAQLSDLTSNMSSTISSSPSSSGSGGGGFSGGGGGGGSVGGW